MYSSLTAVVLCIATQAAVAAECVAPVPVAQHTQPSADQIKHKNKTVATAPAVGAAHSKGELIKTAAAGTHDEVPGLTRSAPVSAAATQDDEPQRRGGPAMLLAALALMSGIALRRFGAHKQ